MLSPEDQNRLDTIKHIRATNNDYWMALLEIALEVAPERTRVVLSAIQSNDQVISDLTKEIANHDHSQTKDRSQPPPLPDSGIGG